MADALPYTPEHPERGFSLLVGEVRRGKEFPRDEVEAALANYQKTAAGAVASGDWNAWADLFTDDAIYVEHHYGVLRGGAEIKAWITNTMQGQVLDMDFPIDLRVIDNDIVMIYVPNRYVAPDGGAPYQFVAITILCYAGDGKFCYEEDIYNVLEAKRVGDLYGEVKRQRAGDA